MINCRLFINYFLQAKRGGYWRDMSYLNIVLQDALQLNYPELMGRFVVASYTECPGKYYVIFVIQKSIITVLIAY